MSSTDTSLTVVNSMTETYLESLKDGSGKIPSMANQLIMTPDDTESGGGGSVDIDNTSITENSSNQIQTVGIIDQKTGNANKQWTGTKAEYDALATHDANTFYNITDDVANEGNLVADITLSSATQVITITGLDMVADGGVYDIVLQWQPVTAVADYVYLEINNQTTGNHYAWIQKYYPSYDGEYNYSANNFRVGHSGTSEAFSYITLSKSNVSGSGLFYSAVNGSFGSAQYNMNFVGTNASLTNVTQLVFYLPRTFKVGTSVKIYKRSTNNARITS